MGPSAFSPGARYLGMERGNNNISCYAGPAGRAVVKIEVATLGKENAIIIIRWSVFDRSPIVFVRIFFIILYFYSQYLVATLSLNLSNRFPSISCHQWMSL